MQGFLQPVLASISGHLLYIHFCIGNSIGSSNLILLSKLNEINQLITPLTFTAVHLHNMKAGFVNIFGKPNAGKSTLLNALMGEKLAIVSSKVQTTRHRIKGIVTTPEYQIIFSDTPGIIEPKYKLHEKMMQAVKGSLEDADVALLLVDMKDNLEEVDAVFSALRLKVPALVLINKMDKVEAKKVEEVTAFFAAKAYCKKVIAISALKKANIK